jgi:hypothetical protein
MYRDQVFRESGLLLCIALLATGCSTTQRMYSDESLSRKEVARIRTISSGKSGSITRRVTVESVDGKEVDSKKHDWVAVLPGTHNIDVSFYKRIDPSGLNIGLTLNVFGVERDLVTPRSSQIITSTVDQSLVIDVRPGRSYHLVASDDIHETQLVLPGVLDIEPLSLPGRLVGFWVPEIIEER